MRITFDFLAVLAQWPLLLKGVPYREIHELTEVSVTTIGRVARTLETGTGGYAAALRRQQSRTTASH